MLGDEVDGTCNPRDDRDDPPVLHEEADHYKDANETNRSPRNCKPPINV